MRKMRKRKERMKRKEMKILYLISNINSNPKRRKLMKSKLLALLKRKPTNMMLLETISMTLNRKTL